MKTVLYFFAASSAVGLVLSLASHAAALMGTSGPLGDHVWELHIGIFVVWIPAVFASTRLTRNVPRKDAWKAALRGCPDWMKYMTYGFFGYALLNFASLFIMAPHGMPAVQGGGPGLMPPQIVRGFSGHWMAFYSAALALLWSAGELWNRDWQRRCPNGHPVGPPAKFCDQCGQPVLEPGSASPPGRNV